MRWARLGGTALLLAAAIIFPHAVNSPLTMTMAIFTLVYAIMATGWNILGGYTGYISLGHAAIFGIGAYALGLLAPHLTVFFDAVRDRKPFVEDALFGHNAALACHMANESYFRKTAVRWDQSARRIIS